MEIITLNEVLMMKKILWMILAIVIVMGLAACMPGMGGGGGGGGGPIYIGGEQWGGEGTTAGQGTTAAPGAAAPAQPAATQAEPAGSILPMLLPFVLMFAVVYFLIMRPQRKQAKATREMQEALRPGDNIITTSGFFGKIVGEGTDCFLVEFGQDRGFKVWVRRADIAGVREPVMTPPPRGEDSRGIEDKKDKK